MRPKLTYDKDTDEPIINRKWVDPEEVDEILQRLEDQEVDRLIDKSRGV